MSARPRRPSGGAAILACLALCSACSRPGGTLYLTSGASDEILILDARDGSPRGDIPTDRRAGELDEPHGVAVSPDGAHLYATLAHGEPTLWKFELPAARRVGRLSLGSAGAARVALSADGETAWVADYERGSGGAPGEVLEIALHELEVTARARPCSAPHDARPDPTGRTLAVACALSDEVVFLDPATLEERARTHAGPSPGAPGTPRYRPMNAAWVDSGLVAVTLMASDEVLFLAPDGRERARVRVGRGPAQIAFDPATGRLVVADREDGSASILSTDPIEEVARVSLGVEHPHGVAIDPASGMAYVTYEGAVDGPGGVVAVDRRGRVRWRADAGFYTLGVAFTPPARPRS